MLGHFRHEIGHYYEALLVDRGDAERSAPRELFGDETGDYRRHRPALRRGPAGGLGGPTSRATPRCIPSRTSRRRSRTTSISATRWTPRAEHGLSTVDPPPSACSATLSLEASGSRYRPRSTRSTTWVLVRLAPFVLAVLDKLWDLVAEIVRDGWQAAGFVAVCHHELGMTENPRSLPLVMGNPPGGRDPEAPGRPVGGRTQRPQKPSPRRAGSPCSKEAANHYARLERIRGHNHLPAANRDASSPNFLPTLLDPVRTLELMGGATEQVWRLFDAGLVELGAHAPPQSI